MTNLTPPSASADDEQDDELDEILYSLIVSYVPHLGNDINKHFYGYKRAKEALAHHTKEAERRARIDELKALLDAEVIKPQYHNMYAQHIKEMEK